MNTSLPTIATIGSHSALDICQGACAEGIPTLVVAQSGRNQTYARHYVKRVRGGRTIGCIDKIVEVKKFSEILSPHVVSKLSSARALFVPHKTLTAHLGYDDIERSFPVPMLGNRRLLRAEERGVQHNQYALFKEAGIRTPKRFASSGDIDRLCIVKVADMRRGYYERAFFLASSPKEFEVQAQKVIASGAATRESIDASVIEEFVLGAQVNFNFFYSPLHKELELMGTDTRRQTNLDGLLRLPADVQVHALSHLRATFVEVGHVACTVRESLLESGFSAGERFVHACQKLYAPGIIGPFALQGALAQVEEDGKLREEFVVFDASLRIPGSPGTRFTPYSEYLFGSSVSMGRRLAMEVKDAHEHNQIDLLTT